MRRKIAYVFSLLLLFLMTALWPIQSTWLENRGTDIFEAHYPIHQGQLFEQEIVLPRGEITNIGVILVPYLGQANGLISLSIKDMQNKVLATGVINAANLVDDTFTMLSTSFRHHGHAILAIEVDADRPFVALRHEVDEDSNLGATTLLVQRKTNIYGAIFDGLKARLNLFYEILWALVVGIVATASFYFVKGKDIKIGRVEIARWLLLVAFMAIAATVWRFNLMGEIRGTSGGDAYNFAQISQRIAENGQFYHPEQKRLPVYPLVLIPGLIFTNDYFFVARAVNQLAVGLSIILIAILARQFKLKPEVAVLAATLLAFNRDFIFIPLRPLAYPLLGLFLLFGLVASVHYFTKRFTNKAWLIAAAFSFGLAAQTRQEGLIAVIAILFLVSAHLLYKKKRRDFLFFALPISILVLPYFIANFVNFGNLFYSAYLDHPVTNPRRSWHEIQDHIGQAWAVLSSTWFPRWRHQIRFDFNGFLIISLMSAAALIPLSLYKERVDRVKKWIVNELILSSVVVLASLGILLTLAQKGGATRELVVAWLVIASLVGIIKLIIHSWQEKVVLPLLTMFVIAFIITAIATWVHPVAKTFVSSLPYLALAAASGIGLLLDNFSRKNFIAPLLVFSIIALPFIPAVQTADLNLDFFSKRHVLSNVRYEAARYAARRTEENISVSQLHLPYSLFLKDRIKENDQTAPLEIRVSVGDKLSDEEKLFSVWGFDEEDKIVEASIIRR